LPANLPPAPGDHADQKEVEGEGEEEGRWQGREFQAPESASELATGASHPASASVRTSSIWTLVRAGGEMALEEVGLSAGADRRTGATSIPARQAAARPAPPPSVRTRARRRALRTTAGAASRIRPRNVSAGAGDCQAPKRSSRARALLRTEAASRGCAARQADATSCSASGQRPISPPKVSARARKRLAFRGWRGALTEPGPRGRRVRRGDRGTGGSPGPRR
jgi:hypothetical protein